MPSPADNYLSISASFTLTDGISGGTWSSSNTSATVSGGVVTSISLGVDTIDYTVSNSCGTAISTKVITVSPLPNAGSIIGGSNVCIGSIITLTDGITGGTWNTSNANATVIGGLVTGVIAGSDTISYLITNVCGSATVSSIITINPLPNAGVITY